MPVKAKNLLRCVALLFLLLASTALAESPQTYTTGSMRIFKFPIGSVFVIFDRDSDPMPNPFLAGSASPSYQIVQAYAASGDFAGLIGVVPDLSGPGMLWGGLGNSTHLFSILSGNAPQYQGGPTFAWGAPPSGTPTDFASAAVTIYDADAQNLANSPHTTSNGALGRIIDSVIIRPGSGRDYQMVAISALDGSGAIIGQYGPTGTNITVDLINPGNLVPGQTPLYTLRAGLRQVGLNQYADEIDTSVFNNFAITGFSQPQ